MCSYYSLSINYVFYLYFFLLDISQATMRKRCDRLCRQCILWFSAAIFICRKCRNNEAAYPAFGLESSMKLEHLTAHWTWLGLSKTISNIKVDLKGLQILTPHLRQRLQDLLYACGLNLTAHRIMVVHYVYLWVYLCATHIIFHLFVLISFSNKSCKNKSGDFTKP